MIFILAPGAQLCHEALHSLVAKGIDKRGNIYYHKRQSSI